MIGCVYNVTTDRFFSFSLGWTKYVNRLKTDNITRSPLYYPIYESIKNGDFVIVCSLNGKRDINWIDYIKL